MFASNENSFMPEAKFANYSYNRNLHVFDVLQFDYSEKKRKKKSMNQSKHSYGKRKDRKKLKQ